MPSVARRILTFPVTRLVLASLFVIAAFVGAQLLVGLLKSVTGVERGIFVSLVGIVVTLPPVYGAYLLFVRIVERRRLDELAWRYMPGEMGVGFVVGAGLFGVTVGVLWLIGCYRVTGTSASTVLVSSLLVALTHGFFEEILFRGILFRIIEESLGTWIALVVSALVFGVLHMVNPNSTVQGVIAISLEAGVLLAAAYALTRRLWLVIGLHTAWNYTQGGIFGINVSGTEARGLLSSEMSGHGILTGGEFGAEGSVVAVVICCVASIVFVWLVVRGKRVVKPFWVKVRPSPGADPG